MSGNGSTHNSVSCITQITELTFKLYHITIYHFMTKRSKENNFHCSPYQVNKNLSKNKNAYRGTDILKLKNAYWGNDILKLSFYCYRQIQRKFYKLIKYSYDW